MRFLPAFTSPETAFGKKMKIFSIPIPPIGGALFLPLRILHIDKYEPVLILSEMTEAGIEAARFSSDALRASSIELSGQHNFTPIRRDSAQFFPCGPGLRLVIPEHELGLQSWWNELFGIETSNCGEKLGILQPNHFAIFSAVAGQYTRALEGINVTTSNGD